MPDNKETPAPQRRQAEGETGVRVAERSVPTWAQKRRGASLVRFGGQYLTPEQVHAQAAIQAAEARTRSPDPSSVKGGPQGRRSAPLDAQDDQARSGVGLVAASPPPSPCRTAADFAWEPSQYVIDGETGELLPCRSLETTSPRGGANHLSGQHRKVANALSWNVAHLCEKFGINHVGFLTLTFADHVTDAREASRRYKSLTTHVLSIRYAACIRVLERQRSGRIHYHLLVALPDDIRTGVDFDAFAQRDYRTANNHLRREWAFWRKTAPLYRFGRTELMPVKSNADTLGQYVGKYIGKHIGVREERDKGVRLVSYSGDARMATSKHTVLTSHPDQWRAKVATFVRIIEAAEQRRNPYTPPIRSLEDLAFHLGPKWAFHWRDFICGLPPSDLSVPF